MSGLNSKHPLYSDYIGQWSKLRDFAKGEDAVKAKGTLYLPATPNMVEDGLTPTEQGYKAYSAYLQRAVVPGHLNDGIVTCYGLLHKKPPVIELPTSLQSLNTLATLSGETLLDLYRRITVEILTTGRIGLLFDFTDDGMPYISTYTAERVINWNYTHNAFEDSKLPGLDFVVLDESGDVCVDFTWKEENSYRVLRMLNGEYVQAKFENTGYDEALLLPPIYRGKTFNRLPFVFINAGDLLADPSSPPFLELCNIVAAMYRTNADYRQALFNQGQDTLVTIGSIRSATGTDDGNVRIGAGSRIPMEINGDAKFIGVTSEGLPEMRKSLEDDRKQAEAMAGRLINSGTSGNAESGDALGIRGGAQTASLTRIAQSSAAGLQAVLRMAAEWMGANPDDVKVEPNLEFVKEIPNPDSLVKLMAARAQGAVLSLSSIHAYSVRQGFTTNTYEQELELMNTEQPPGNAL